MTLQSHLQCLSVGYGSTLLSKTHLIQLNGPLHLSVILSTTGMSALLHARIHTPWADTPLGRPHWVDTPQVDTPQVDTPPSPRQTPQADIPIADHNTPRILRDTVNKHALRIPLECILV